VIHVYVFAATAVAWNVSSRVVPAHSPASSVSTVIVATPAGLPTLASHVETSHVPRTATVGVDTFDMPAGIRIRARVAFSVANGSRLKSNLYSVTPVWVRSGDIDAE
jgi:hypothetical protein